MTDENKRHIDKLDFTFLSSGKNGYWRIKSICSYPTQAEAQKIAREIQNAYENQRTQTDIENEKIIEDMEKLFERAIDTYNNPDSDEENKRWGFYTATALQALLENRK